MSVMAPFLFGEAESGSSDIVVILFLLVSAFVLLALLAWVVRRTGVMRQAQYIERAHQHLDWAEEKTERMIELLESIDRKLGKGEGDA